MCESVDHEIFMRKAIELAKFGSDSNEGGPFGAVVVRNNKIIGPGGFNRVISSNDSNAHGEIIAIRNAEKCVGTFSLENCDLYTSCEPCPMCLAASYWARIRKIFYAATREDAEAIGFDDSRFYEDLNMNPLGKIVAIQQLGEELRSEAVAVMREWFKKESRVKY